MKFRHYTATRNGAIVDAIISEEACEQGDFNPSEYFLSGTKWVTLAQTLTIESDDDKLTMLPEYLTYS